MKLVHGYLLKENIQEESLEFWNALISNSLISKAIGFDYFEMDPIILMLMVSFIRENKG